MYIITAASGKIGKLLAAELLAKGKKVRVIGRSAENLKTLTDSGAEVMLGDLTDAVFVNKAFAGGTAAFCLIPPVYHSNNFRMVQRQIASNYLDAVKQNHISHVVLLSSIGAHLRNGAGVVDGLGDMEEMFSHLTNVNVLNLRAGYFMENLFGQIETIKAMGIMGSAIKADMKFPIVATKDIASVAAKRLLDLTFNGHTIEYVLGQRDVTYNELAAIIGNAIGKPDLKYVQFSYEDAKNGMVQSGFVSEDVAELFNGLAESMNSGLAQNAHTRTHLNTTPTSVEEFARAFAHGYSF